MSATTTRPGAAAALPTRGSAPVITTNGLTKRYGAVTALDDLTLEVSAGEVLGYLGPNGAGKTTTIRLLLGLIGATSGSGRLPMRRRKAPCIDV